MRPRCPGGRNGSTRRTSTASVRLYILDREEAVRSGAEFQWMRPELSERRGVWASGDYDAKLRREESKGKL